MSDTAFFTLFFCSNESGPNKTFAVELTDPMGLRIVLTFSLIVLISTIFSFKKLMKITYNSTIYTKFLKESKNRNNLVRISEATAGENREKEQELAPIHRTFAML